jgi:hypothetical protein
MELDTEVETFGGVVLVEILTVVKVEHPLLLLVTISVYVPDDVNVAVEVLVGPEIPVDGVHVKDTLDIVPVLAVIVGEELEQVMVSFDAESVILGAFESGNTLAVATAVQPLAAVPITVYVPGLLIVTVAELAPLTIPLPFHVYDIELPLATICEVGVAQDNVCVDGEVVIEGAVVLDITATVAVVEQPFVVLTIFNV